MLLCHTGKQRYVFASKSSVKTVCCYFQRCRLLVRNSLCSTSNWQPPLQTSSAHWPLGRNQRNDQEAKLLHSGQLNCKIHKAENLFSSKLKQNFPRWFLNKLIYLRMYKKCQLKTINNFTVDTLSLTKAILSHDVKRWTYM